MNDSELTALVDRLRGESTETEWLEFKANHLESQSIGEYISALANSASIAGKPNGYLVFGIDDSGHNIVGTKFEPKSTKAKGNQDLLIWLSQKLQPNVGVETHILNHPEGRVVVFKIGTVHGQPIRFDGKAYVRVGASKTLLDKHPEKERAIWTRRGDWSGQICESASLDSLDPDAISMALTQFKIKTPTQSEQIDSWDVTTFLNKARLTIQGSLTNTAILLLGNTEAATLLSPAVAKISWLLKDDKNRDLDYEHFGPPFILTVDRVLKKIRNLILRTLPSGTLFPQEITQYDSWVIREALHNCIAHQDYTMGGRVNLIETPNALRLTNVGSFLPGNVEKVVYEDAPPEIYRNPFLADAMVSLNMIDTQGGGIKRMFRTQMKRFFPLPDYDLSEPDRVAVTVGGEIMDEQYSRLLMERADLDLREVMLLDKIQKRITISRQEHAQLKAAGLVEGRYPHLLIAGHVAKLTGHEAKHIRERGLNKQHYMALIIELIREHGPIGRSKINDLLLDKLPEIYNTKQKVDKIHNLLTELKRKNKIHNIGTRARPEWELIKGNTN
ncbi:MAG: RNA-binding domain-containing protein [Desulfomonilaceae bacterium]